MNQSITIAKVRKETSIKVPAGGWIVLVQPEEPWANHAGARQKIAAAGRVNDEYSVVAVGKLNNQFSDLKLLTEEEDKKQTEQLKASEKQSVESAKSAEARQKKLSDDAAARERKAHQDKIASINKEHDAIRNRQLAA